MQVQTPGKQHVDGVGNSAEAGAHDDIERIVMRGNNLPLAATPVCVRRLLTTRLIALDVGGTQLNNSDLETVVTWTPWLRALSAAGNCEVVKALGHLFFIQLLSNKMVTSVRKKVAQKFLVTSYKMAY